VIRSVSEVILELALNLNNQQKLHSSDYLEYFCQQCTVGLNLAACMVVAISADTADKLLILNSYPEPLGHDNLVLDLGATHLDLCGVVGEIREIDSRTYMFDAGSLGHVLMLGELQLDQQVIDNFARLVSNISDTYSLALDCMEIKEQNQRLILATKAGGIGTWELDTVSHELRWDDQMFRLFEVDKNSFDGTYEFLNAQLHPDDTETLLGIIENYLTQVSVGPIDFQFRIITPAGKIKKIAGYADIKTFLDGRSRLIGVNYDITEIETARTQSLYRSQLENLLINLSMKVIRSGPDDFDQVTNDALQVVGEFVGRRSCVSVQLRL
jgi:PAS domain-containing protein